MSENQDEAIGNTFTAYFTASVSYSLCWLQKSVTESTVTKSVAFVRDTPGLLCAQIKKNPPSRTFSCLQNLSGSNLALPWQSPYFCSQPNTDLGGGLTCVVIGRGQDAVEDAHAESRFVSTCLSQFSLSRDILSQLVHLIFFVSDKLCLVMVCLIK